MKPRVTGGLLAGIVREVMPSPIYYVRAQPQGAEPVLIFMKPLGGPYEGMPEPSHDAALVSHRFGQGSAVYSSGDLGGTIGRYHMAEHMRLLENAVRLLAPPPVLIENAPRSLEVTLRSQQEGKRLLLHLINFTGEMTRPIRRVMPLENVRITLRTSGIAGRVFTLVGSQELKPLRNTSGSLQFVLPHMEEYEVVVVERQMTA